MKQLKFLLAITSCILPMVGCSDDNSHKNTIDPSSSYEERNKVELYQWRAFGETAAAYDAVTFSNSTLDQKLKWQIFLVQMLEARNPFQQARAAFQLNYLGITMGEIERLWHYNQYRESYSPSELAAFDYAVASGHLPSTMDATHHKALRRYFSDRQIVEMFTVTSVGAADAVYTSAVASVLDSETLQWAEVNLSELGWSVGNHVGKESESRYTILAGDLLEDWYEDLMVSYNPLSKTIGPILVHTDWISLLIGDDIPRSTDADLDGVEDAYDAFPYDDEFWQDTDNDGLADDLDEDDDNDGLTDEAELVLGTSVINPDTDNDGVMDGKDNQPLEGVATFNALKYDRTYSQNYEIKENYNNNYMDRQYLENMWWRKQGEMAFIWADTLGLNTDSTISSRNKWRAFLVQVIAGHCVHCQAHGAYFMHIKGFSLKEILGAWDIERDTGLSEKELAYLRFARDAGTLPSRVTAEHMAHLRHYYSDRQISEILAQVYHTAKLSSEMQSSMPVTDSKSADWAKVNLASVGWKLGAHAGTDEERRPYFPLDGFQEFARQLQAGGNPDIADLFIAGDDPIPLATDADNDGVEDDVDGFPNDATKWADSDRDGIEDLYDLDDDNDGLTDDEEIILGTSIVRADSDRDGYSDQQEIDAGTDPWDKSSH